MPASLRWIRFIDPISYAYEAVLANEMSDLQFACSPSDTVPRGRSYDDPAYQTCAVLGSQPRSLYVSGARYLSIAYGFSANHLARNLALLLALAAAFLFLAICATNFFHFAPSGAKRLYNRTAASQASISSKRHSYAKGSDAEAQSVSLKDQAEAQHGLTASLSTLTKARRRLAVGLWPFRETRTHSDPLRSGIILMFTEAAEAQKRMYSRMCTEKSSRARWWRSWAILAQAKQHVRCFQLSKYALKVE